MKSLIMLAAVAVCSTAWSASCSCIELGGEALYWRPLIGPFKFGTQRLQPGTDDQELLKVNPDHHWGFKLFADYHSPTCGMDFRASWTYYSSHDGVTVRPSGPGSLSTLGGFDDAQWARASIHTKYDRVTVRASRLASLRCLTAGLYVGGRYFNVEVDRKVKSVHPRGRGVAANEGHFLFEGGGVELGLRGSITLPCNFSLSTLLGGAALIGRTHDVDRSQSLEGIAAETIVRLAPTTVCRPALDFRLELGYTCCCSCFSFKAYIAYEIDYYLRVEPFAQSISVSDQQSQVGFGGPLLGLSVSF